MPRRCAKASAGVARILIGVVPVFAFGVGADHAAAQADLDDIRDQLRSSLRTIEFAKSVASLVQVAEELELAGARYEIDNESGTTVSLFSLPGGRSFDVFGNSTVRLRAEGVLAVARASEDSDDIFGGASPGSEAAVEADWTTLTGLVGFGPEFEPVEGLTVSALANVGLSYIKNDASYGGPGADAAAALFDGLALNWSSWVGSLGVAARGQLDRPLGERLRYRLTGRYDIRHVETLASDDPAQDFSTTLQFATLRADLFGPTGLAIRDSEIEWRATVAYKEFITGDLFGVERFVQIGSGLRLLDALPFGAVVSLNGSAVFGDDLTGFGLGLGLGF